MARIADRSAPLAGPALARCFLVFFLIGVFALLHPGQPVLQLREYLHAMCHALERAARGEVQRLAVVVPPRHLKSITASVALVAWLLGQDPRLKIVVATYSEELAREHAEACLRVMESRWYRLLFPHTVIDRQHRRRLSFRTTAGGGRRAVSVTGSITGLGADVIILDDCMKADDIDSEAMREKAKRWYTNTLLTRLNNKRRGTIISIQQRLSEDDLTAVMLERGAELLLLPAIAEREELVPIGFGRVWRRRVGEVLDPEREDRATLDRYRREMGPDRFATQYQGQPTAPGGNMVRVDRFPRYGGDAADYPFGKILQSWDTGTSASPDSDWSVCLTAGYHDGKLYILDLFRARLDYPELREAVIDQKRIWKPDQVIMEDAGLGRALYQELHRARGTVHMRMWTPEHSKAERMRGQLGQIEDGRVLLPEHAPWLDTFLAELRAFPRGRHDDQADALSQLLAFALSREAWMKVPINPLTGRKLYVKRRASVNRR